MPSQKYALKKGGPKRLEISSGIFSQKRTIRLDGKELGIIANERELKQGWSLTSKSGMILAIKKGSAWGAQYDIRLNDVPLPNTDGDPQRRVNNAVGAILYVAISTVVVGLMAMSSRTGFMGVEQSAAMIVLVTGLVYGVMAFFVWRGSLIALGLTIAGYGLDNLSMILSSPLGFLSLGVAGLIVRPIIFYLMILAINPIRKLKAQPSAEAKPREPLSKVELTLILVVVLLIGVVAVVLAGKFLAGGGLPPR
jgi:hypothetical protein